MSSFLDILINMKEGQENERTNNAVEVGHRVARPLRVIHRAHFGKSPTAHFTRLWANDSMVTGDRS
jgi:hypothetical protein